MKEISLMVADACQEFYECNKFFPELIIIFRDGVGEGQINKFLEIENSAILKGFATLSEHYKPQFA